MANNTKYIISPSVNEGILEIVLTGKLTESDGLNMTNEVSDLVKNNNINKVIINVSDLDGRLSITDTYLRVRSYPPHMYRIQLAIVDVVEQDVYERYHEATSLNAGMKVKCFTDINEARAWLNFDNVRLSKSVSFRDQVETEDHCKIIINAFEGVLYWKWDSRYATALAEFDIEKKDEICIILKQYFSTVWNRSNIKRAPDTVQHIVRYLGRLWPGQILLTSDTNKDYFIFCAWWPWEDGKTISIRIAPFYEKALDSQKMDYIQKFKKWFGF